MSEKVFCRKCGSEMHLVKKDYFDDVFTTSSAAPDDEEFDTTTASSPPPGEEPVRLTYKCTNPNCQHEEDKFMVPV